MPEQFKSKNGATIAGHSAKWSDSKRGQNSHEAGRGSRGSRNQGTGSAGKANTVASDAIDTSRMKPDEKLRYFKSLGLLGKEPEPEPVPKANPVQELSSKLGKIFQAQPNMLMDIVNKLKSLPKEELKHKALDILNVMNDNTSTDPNQVHGAIMSVFNQEPQSQDKSDMQFISDFFHKAGADDRKTPEAVESLLGRFAEQSHNDPAKISKAKQAIDAMNANYVAGEQSKYIAGMNAAFGALR